MADNHRDRWTDERLLREANRGDTQAFTEFCVRRLPTLLRYLKYQCSEQNVSPDLAEDFCHDAIVRAVEHINSCKEHGDRPLPTVSVAWLKQIAFNVIRDWRRRNNLVTFVDEIEQEAQDGLSYDDIEESE